MRLALSDTQLQLWRDFRNALSQDTLSEVRRYCLDQHYFGLTIDHSHGGLGLGQVESTLFSYEAGHARLGPQLAQYATGVELLHSLHQSTAHLNESAMQQAVRGECGLNIVPRRSNSELALDVVDQSVFWNDVINPTGITGESSSSARTRIAVSPATTVAARFACLTGALRQCAYLLGLAEHAIRQAVRYCSQRRQFGRALSANQAVIFPLTSCQVQGDAYLQRAMELAAKLELEVDIGTALEAFTTAVDHYAPFAINTAVHAHGAAGLTGEHTVSTCYARLCSTYYAALFLGPSRYRGSRAELPVPDAVHRSSDQRDLNYLPRALRQRVPTSWTFHSRTYPQKHGVHQLIHETAMRFPDYIAVVCGDSSITYRELISRSSAVAAALQNFGFRPGIRIGVYINRSVELIIAILGIMSSGAAYVPLDPQYPDDRLNLIANDSGLSLVIAQDSEPVPDGFPRVTSVQQLEVESHTANDIVDQSDANDLVYILYTSGSTGHPKGVAIEHSSLLNRLQWDRETFPLGTDDAVLHHTSLNFDAAALEIFVPLISGSRLLLAKPGGSREIVYIAELISSERATIVMGVPSFLDVLVEEMQNHPADYVRYVFAGGESLPPTLASRVFDVFTNATLCSFYGPTEATIDATVWECTPQSIESGIPIGRPLPNVRVVLLDDAGVPVPVGMSGEIYIGGAGVARGYIGSSDSDNASFFFDPFAGTDEPNPTLYRTGDLARYRSDSAIEFLGRSDDQVKVRGFRIELGEIESRLETHLAVRRAAVVLPRHDLLHACVVTSQDISRDDLISFLRTLLPNHLVLSEISFHGDFPALPSGKVDRQALAETARISHEEAAPRTREPGGLTDAILRIMEAIVGYSISSETTDFFESGGTSLQAARFVARARRELNLDISMGSFLRSPTAAGVESAHSENENVNRSSDHA